MNSKTTLKCIHGIGTIAKRYQAYSTFQGIGYSKQYLVHNIDTVLMRSEQSAGEKQSKENKYTLEWIINIGILYNYYSAFDRRSDGETYWRKRRTQRDATD